VPADGYDRFAAAYAEHNERSAWNAGYERPAALALAGEVDGLRVLDAGCGAGALSRELMARGAVVTGLDASAGLLAVARDRLGPAVPLVHGDLAEPLPFPDATFDLVVSSLVLHYLRNWSPVLSELRRVLAPGGRIVASTHHPFMDHPAPGHDDYFATYRITETWEVAGARMTVSFWHRPLKAIVDAFVDAGFALDRIDEPAPRPEVEAADPEAWRSLTTEPRFLFVAGRRPPSTPSSDAG
jgi:SAM-dependent methyltransferase